MMSVRVEYNETASSAAWRRESPAAPAAEPRSFERTLSDDVRRPAFNEERR
jgi:hypothetical protein